MLPFFQGGLDKKIYDVLKLGGGGGGSLCQKGKFITFSDLFFTAL